MGVGGKPVVDAFTLPLGVASLHGKQASLTFQRADKTKIQLDWQVPESCVISSGEGSLGPTGFELPGTGLVYAPSNVVTAVDASSLAAKRGIAPGDVVKQFRFDGNDEEDSEYMSKVFVSGYKGLLEETPLDKGHNIQYFHNLSQAFRAGTPVGITTGPDGQVAVRGFRIVKGGGTFIWPVIEKVDVLSLELLTIDVQTPEVYTSKGVPVKVDGVAQIKVKGDDISIATAAEQFLSKRVEDIKNIAMQTLEGHLRAGLAGGGQDLRPVLGHDLLVGRDHLLPLAEGPEDEVVGRLLLAHQLHHQIDLRVVQYIHGVQGEQGGVHGSDMSRLADPVSLQS